MEDLHLAKCGTLYSAVFNNAHNYYSWGLNFVGSPATKFMPLENLTHGIFAPCTNISTSTVYNIIIYRVYATQLYMWAGGNSLCLAAVC